MENANRRLDIFMIFPDTTRGADYSSAPAIMGVLAVPELQTYAKLSLDFGALVLDRRRTARS
jgi:hypothetical protein